MVTPYEDALPIDRLVAADCGRLAFHMLGTGFSAAVSLTKPKILRGGYKCATANRASGHGWL